MNIWFFSRSFRYPIFFDGNIKNTHTYIDGSYSYEWYKYRELHSKPDLITDPSSIPYTISFEDTIVEYNDKAHSIRLPTLSPKAPLDPWSYIDHSEDVRMQLAQFARRRILDDTTFWLALKILREYSAIQHNDFPDHLIFIPTISPLTSVSKLWYNIVLWMKEYVEWYVFPDQAYFFDQHGNEKISNIWTDIILPNPFYKKQIQYPYSSSTTVTPNGIHVPNHIHGHTPLNDYRNISFDLTASKEIKLPHNYTLNLRNALFWEQAILNYRYWVFSSIKMMQDRQYDAEIREAPITIIGWVRRVWKTFKLVHTALKKCMKPNFRSIFQPTTILYVGLSRKSLRQPITYLLHMIKQFGPIGKELFHRDSANLVLTFKVDTYGTWDPKPIGQIIFISAKEDDPGVWLGANVVIFDEMVKLPRKVIEDIMPIVTHQGAELIGASTNYYDEPLGLFHELMQEAEAQQTKYDDVYKRIALQYRETVKNDIPENRTGAPITNLSSQAPLDSDSSPLYPEPSNPEDAEFEKMIHDMWLDKYLESSKDNRFNSDIYIPDAALLKTDRPKMIWLRYNIDDAEFIPPWEKEAIKQRYEKNPARYNAELYCRFSGDNQWFNYAGHVLPLKDIIPNRTNPDAPVYKYLVAAYDPALTKDTSGFILMWYNERKRILVIIEERRLYKDWTYITQFKQIKEILMHWSKVYGQSAATQTFNNDTATIILPQGFIMVMDGTDKWLTEYVKQNGIPVTFHYAYTSGGQIRDGISTSEFLVPKEIMAKVAKYPLDNWFVKINEMCTLIQKEFDTFKAFVTPAGNIVFEADEKKGPDGLKNYDDLTNGFMLASLTLLHSRESKANRGMIWYNLSSVLFHDVDYQKEEIHDLQNNYMTLLFKSKQQEKADMQKQFYKKYMY